ncbi:MAG: 16S rRNA (adenine(1518)-N(6)/adenine(1519)-N(6))-dimethyltransferase RsmA [Patescibacteria group bacterium]
MCSRFFSSRSTPIAARKSLGQHFLRCAWVANAMSRAAGLTKTDVVLEVGPGMGALTYMLASSAGRVIAIEKDDRLAAMLAADLRKRGILNVDIIRGDILEWIGRLGNEKWWREGAESTEYKIVSAIPYYLTSRLIRALLETKTPPETIVLTIQKEVGERIVARPPSMNLLGLAVQIYAEAKIIKDVPADCFRPRPKVDSVIIKITPRPGTLLAADAIDSADFFTIAQKAFGQKRKMLARSLKEYRDALPLKAQKKRPQELDADEWVALIAAIRNKSNTPMKAHEEV